MSMSGWTWFTGSSPPHCDRPPRGWICHLQPKHDGPCPTYPRWWNLRGQYWHWCNTRPASPWRAPRNGGYQARPGVKPPTMPPGPGSASTSHTYGLDQTWHRTETVDVEIRDGHVVAVWFRCQMLAFTENAVDQARADDMVAHADDASPIIAVELPL